MPTIQLATFIHAPIGLCFDLTRTVEVHAGKHLLTTQYPIDGLTAGMLEYGDSVTWKTSHFGIKHQVTSKIDEMNPPYSFTDQMVHGPFESFTHTHRFIDKDENTLMIDLFSYTSPFGLLGQLADQLFLKRYMHAFIAKQALSVKKLAEKSMEKQDKESLLKQIELVRKQMNILSKTKSLTDSEVVKMSQVLDLLLNDYNRIK